MSILANLPPNTISIYGFQGQSGLSFPTSAGQPPIFFAVIDQMYFGAAVDLTGQRVAVSLQNAIPMKVEGSGYNYFLIQEGDIILTETDAP